MKILCTFIGYVATGLIIGLTRYFAMKSEYKRNTFCKNCGRVFTFENPKEAVDINGNWHCRECSKFL